MSKDKGKPEKKKAKASKVTVVKMANKTLNIPSVSKTQGNKTKKK